MLVRVFTKVFLYDGSEKDRAILSTKIVTRVARIYENIRMKRETGY